jgi:hypothetical protein
MDAMNFDKMYPVTIPTVEAGKATIRLAFAHPTLIAEHGIDVAGVRKVIDDLTRAIAEVKGPHDCEKLGCAP